jgi:hypothetical protein
MSEQEQTAPHDGQQAAVQQQQQPVTEGHAGKGSDSAMRHLRVWEQDRASNSGGKSREGPD